MIERRHEKMTLDALQDLVGFLRGVREERKAILAITDGWLLYRPDRRWRARWTAAPSDRTDRRRRSPSGRLTIGDPRAACRDRGGCDSERIQLAQIDNEEQFRGLLDEANRANASFYPIDPRGLAVFDTDIGPDRPPPLQVDAAMLRAG